MVKLERVEHFKYFNKKIKEEGSKMKLILTKVNLILLLMYAIPMMCFGDEFKKVYSNHIAIYESIKVENKKKLDVEGISVNKFGFDEIYAYALAGNNKLFILGKKEKEYDLLLMAIDLADINKRIIVMQDRLFGKQPVALMKFIVFSELEVGDNQNYLILTYHEDLSGNRNDYEVTTVEIYKQRKNMEFEKIIREQIEEVNICYSVSFTNKDDENGYYAYICNPDEDDLDKNENYGWPARKTINKIYLNDVNHDGYEDILIWRKITRSKLKNETNDSQDYAFDSERLYVMYFDPETMSFAKRIPLDWE